MTESICANKLTELVEQLNMETTCAPISLFDQSYPQGDSSDDFWCEDGLLDDVSDVGSKHVSVLDKEWKRRHEQFHTMGYRDGLLAGKEASAQEGFNAGFRQSVRAGHNWGLVRGVTSAMAALPDELKGKLVGRPENRERFQNLHESVQAISSNDAMKMFNNSILLAEPVISDDQLQGKPHDNEDHFCNQLESHYKELALILHECLEIKVNVELDSEMVG